MNEICVYKRDGNCLVKFCVLILLICCIFILMSVFAYLKYNPTAVYRVTRETNRLEFSVQLVSFKFAPPH